MSSSHKSARAQARKSLARWPGMKTSAQPANAVSARKPAKRTVARTWRMADSRAAQRARDGALGQRQEVEQHQEVDRAELPVERGLGDHPRAGAEIHVEQRWHRGCPALLRARARTVEVGPCRD